MTYWKLGTRWGSWQPDFYPLLREHSLVICSDRPMKAGDVVAIADGFTIIAIARLKEDAHSVELDNDLQNAFKKYEIDSYEDEKEDWNHVADAEIWELEKDEQFEYAARQGIIRIQLESVKKNLATLLHEKTKMNEYKRLLLGNRNLILTGAPGTGKTHTAKDLAEKMGATWDMVQFHPSYDYTDFVEGLRPVQINGQVTFERRDGKFKEFCKKALAYEKSWPCSTLASLKDEIKALTSGKIDLNDNGKVIELSIQEGGDALQLGGETLADSDFLAALSAPENGPARLPAALAEYIGNNYPKKPFIFIIDEINRGEISKIFGELFFSIDPGYRGKNGKVATQYQNLIPNTDEFGEGFFVPENVYILGTMNDIDRNVESMDFAMRRRFAWRDVSAAESQEMLDSKDAWQEHGQMPEPAVIEELKKRMDNLNKAIVGEYKKDESDIAASGLTQAYQIGAAYFLKYANYQNFEDLWKYHLEGLLREYLRGQPQIKEKLAYLKQAYDDAN